MPDHTSRRRRDDHDAHVALILGVRRRGSAEHDQSTNQPFTNSSHDASVESSMMFQEQADCQA
jgi:hypothetical protein